MREGEGMDHRLDQPGARAPVSAEVQRHLLRDAVFVQLLGAILRGDYRRGQRLRLDEIAAFLGVSRTPVREALVPLESLQLVLVQRYVGVVIADWNVDHMVERLRLVRRLLVDPPVDSRATTGPTPQLRFDAASTRDTASEAGVACLLAEWVFRRRGCPVSADLVAAMRPLLDLVYSDDIARRQGFDAAVDRRVRLRLVDTACARAAADDSTGAARATAELLEALADLPGRFRAAAAS